MRYDELFQVGDKFICDCRFRCPVATVSEINNKGTILLGISDDGKELCYLLPEDDKLRKLTKLELALK